VDYTVRVSRKIGGEIIPLFYVAEAMAKHAASGYGETTLHGPTLKNIRPQRVKLLLHAARQGQLTVCDYDGLTAPADGIIKSAQATSSLNQRIENSDEMDITALYVRSQHLIEWGKANGDIFHVVDTPVDAVEFDLRDENGELIEAGYFRGYVGLAAGQGSVTSGTTEKGEKLKQVAPPATDKNAPVLRTTKQIAEFFPPPKGVSSSNWKKTLSDPPGWMRHARENNGKSGVSGLWNPAMFALCMASEGHITKSNASTIILRDFADWLGEWGRLSSHLL